MSSKFGGNIFKIFCRSAYTKARPRKLVTLNEMPVPKGDFDELECARQRKNNCVLILGIVMAASALAIIPACDNFNFNYKPPDYYGPRP